MAAHCCRRKFADFRRDVTRELCRDAKICRASWLASVSLMLRSWHLPLQKRSSYQIVAAAIADRARDKFADRRRFVENDARIDVRRVRLRSRDQRLIDEQSQFASDVLRRNFSGDFLLCQHCTAVSFVFYTRGNLSRHLRRTGALLLRIFEDAEPLEPRAFNEVEQRFEFDIGLARKANDECGTN